MPPPKAAPEEQAGDAPAWLESYRAQRTQKAWLASGAHPWIRAALERFPSGSELGDSGNYVIKLQLTLRQMQDAAQRALVLNESGAEIRHLRLLSQSVSNATQRPSLFAQAAESIASRFGQSLQNDRQLLQQLSTQHAEVTGRAIAYWTRIPFPMMVELQSTLSQARSDIDEW